MHTWKLKSNDALGLIEELFIIYTYIGKKEGESFVKAKKLFIVCQERVSEYNLQKCMCVETQRWPFQSRKNQNWTVFLVEWQSFI